MKKNPSEGDMFLESAEIKTLTGRSFVRLQIAALAKMGIPFFVNDVGRPVVARVAVEGGGRTTAPKPPKKTWAPKVLQQS